MQTLQPIMKVGLDSWDRISMPESEFRERVAKIQNEMAQVQIDILLAYGRGPDDYGDTCYISNLVARDAVVAVRQSGDPVLIVQGAQRDMAGISGTTWLKIRSGENLSREVAAYLKETIPGPRRLGLAGFKQIMSHHLWQAMSEVFKSYPAQEADDLIKTLREVKSEREQEQVRRASRIIRHTFEFAASSRYVKFTERRLEASLYHVALLEGAEDVRVLIARPSPGSWSFRPPEDLPLAAGEILIIYLAIEYQRYWAERIITMVADTSRLMEPELSEVGEQYRRAIELIKPHKTAAELFQEINAILDNNAVALSSIFGLGHGIGLGPMESPAICPDNMTVLQPGTVLTLYLAFKDRRLGPVMLGNTLILHRGCTEVITDNLGD